LSLLVKKEALTLPTSGRLLLSATAISAQCECFATRRQHHIEQERAFAARAENISQPAITSIIEIEINRFIAKVINLQQSQ